MTKENKNYKLLFLNIIMFTIVSIIFYFAPYTHDDWAWGSSIGIERLNTLFANYNGRWAGNLFVILLTRCRILKAIFSALILYLIVKLSKKIVNKNNSQLSYLMVILILFMPISVIAQSTFWVSGFTNYVIPVVFLLYYLNFNKNIINKSNENDTIINTILFLFIGFIASLFIENLTIYNMLLSIVVIAYEFIKYKKVSKSNITYFIGSALGTVLMFSNGAYHNVMNQTDNYRSIEQGNVILRAIVTYIKTVYKFFIQNNLLLNIIISIFAIFIVYKFFKNRKRKSKPKKFLLSLSLFTIIGYMLYLIFIYIEGNVNIFITYDYKIYIESIMSVLFYISLFTISILSVESKEKRLKLAFLFISLLIMTGPLLIVNPIGPRCFFASYIFFALIVLEMFDYLVSKNDYKYTLVFVPLILLIFYLLIFAYIYRIESIRNNQIETNKNTDYIVLPNIPYSKYMQYPNPANEIFEERFKLFYGIDKNTRLSFIPYDEYEELID